MATQSYFRPRSLSNEAEDAQALLERYPDLTGTELTRLIQTFRGLPLLDFALMAADERLGDNLEAFYADHGDNLRPPGWGAAWVIALMVLLGLTMLLYITVI